MSLKKRVTLQDIAERAGVHHTTVSLALRNRPKLLPATRERIREIAREMGWQPDPVLSALRNYRHSARSVASGFTLAFVTAFETADYWRAFPAYSRRFAGAEKRASQLGYRLEHFWFDREHMNGSRASQILRTRNVAGLIVAPIKQMAVLDLDWPHFACVSLTFSLQAADMHVVCNNHLDTVRLAYARLRAAGCRRIGLAMEKISDARVLRVWSTGALGEEILVPPRRRVPLHIPERLSRDGFLRWFKRHRPDGVVTVSPHFEILDWIKSTGAGVPVDVRFANLDCPEPSHDTSGVYQDHEVIGMTAVDVLAGLIQRNDLGLPDHPQSIMIRGSWIDGLTTPPPVETPAS